MAEYVNKKTGATINTSSEISGGDWIPAAEYAKQQEGQVDDPDNWTVPELKSKLDELGVEYSDKAKKAELLALLEAHKE